MKQLISLALVIILIMSLSITAFAETVNATGTYSADVTGNYVAGNESSGIVYCVDITWSDLNFTYHAEKGAVWDPDSLTYSEAETAYWEGSGTITISNRSNTGIIVSPNYTPKEGYVDAYMSFSTRHEEIDSAESGTAESGTITVTPNGSLPAMDAADTIGTITLTIEQYTEDLVLIYDAEDAVAEAESVMSEWIAAGGSEEDEDYNILAYYAWAGWPEAIAAFKENPNDESARDHIQIIPQDMAELRVKLEEKLNS